MKSFLKEMQEKFIELESNYCESCDRPTDQCICDNEIEEQNVTGAIAGYNTPAAFAKPGKWQGKKAQYESVNTPPTFKWKTTEDQTPESPEENAQDKFPFSKDSNNWTNKNQEYPVKFTNQPHGTANIKDLSNHKKLTVEDVLERKYEQLIESYRSFANGDPKTTPEQKIKETIKTVAKQLQEIEKTVNYASRLKTESGVNRTGYGSAVETALNKISNRLVKISERVRALGE
jgi:hypothetical protein